MSTPVLYSYFRSSCAWRVRIALNLKDIKFEYRAVNLIKDGGMQRKEEYTALNPMQQVPTLLIDGATLTQSIAIMEYLEEINPSPAILPENPLQRAKVREICEVIASGIQPVQNLQILQKVEKLADAEEKTEWAKSCIVKGFTALESLLSKCAGKYCVGDTITMADICLVPQVFNANRFKVDMSKYPLISKINEELQKNDAFQKASPSKQPDCPEDLRV
ncbi:maleylacetoacetate isomerase-like isoform X2 [Ostrea edulis]|uniref:maleylacetoacetate isomerase-like isoform X2 n=1 Tax=Ostrea edulis TaxID=37623 RepID=UPI00209460C1|nr:maleylacetoacetate isomerase-like isoform X2 [Ostrea edulis]